jgi:hypothetical protein
MDRPSRLPEPVRGRPGKVSTPIAREPSVADAAAMAAEAAAEPEFRFLPVSRVTPAAAEGVGLVVLDGVPSTAVGRPGVPKLLLLSA